MPPVVKNCDPGESSRILEALGKTVIFVAGFSARGYEEPATMLAVVRKELGSYSPDSAVVVGGATADGIGAAYSEARAMGFQTFGIISSIYRASEQKLSDDVGEVLVIDDVTWGGYLPHSEVLAPVSLTIITVSDIYLAFGGGDIVRAEAAEMRRAGKPVRTFPLKDALGAWSTI